MADPITVACAADTWVKVATNVTVGQVTIKNNAPRLYRFTYVMTGNPAPTDDTLSHGFTSGTKPIQASAGIDVYIKAVDEDGLVIVEV